LGEWIKSLSDREQKKKTTTKKEAQFHALSVPTFIENTRLKYLEANK
jgi:hypothetical protein